MALYEYKGLNLKGKNVKGAIEADSQRSAQSRLKKDGIFVIEIKSKKRVQKKSGKNSFGGKASTEDLSMMTRQLATLLKANIPLVDTLAAVSDQVEHPGLKSALSEIRDSVNEGTALNRAMAKYPKYFSKIFVSMTEAGETSGTLDQILLRLAEFAESQDELNQKIKSAMIYPVVMLIFTTLMLMGLFVYVIPKITVIFEQTDMQLPWYSQIVIDMSEFLVNYWWGVIAGMIGSYFCFRFWKNTPNGSKQWDRIVLRLPIVGKLARMVAVSRFTRTLSTLLTGGVPMLQAMDIVKNVVDSDPIEIAIENARDNISEGESIAGPLRKSGEFPPIVLHMVAIGEKTGDLENMLTQVSESYDFQVKTQVQGLTALLEPLLIVVMGVVIGIIVVAIMIPIFEMSNLGG